MNRGSMLSVLAASAIMGGTFVLSTVLARKSSTSSSITKGNNNNRASQSNVGLSIVVDSALEYYVRGEYKKADIFFEKVLEIEPNHIETLNNRGLLNKKKAETTSQQKVVERPAAATPPSVETTSQQKVVERPAAAAPPSVETTSQQKVVERPAPSPDSGTISRADPRNPYNDPTLPGYNPNLGKKKEDASQQKVVERPAAAAPPSVETTSQQKVVERPAPSPDSGTISRADPRNPYNDPTLPGYNP